MDENIKAQLDRIEANVSLLARAVFGEKESGLNGIVHDMQVLKEFREKQNLKAATIAGGVTVFMLLAKSIFGKLFP